VALARQAAPKTSGWNFGARSPCRMLFSPPSSEIHRTARRPAHFSQCGSGVAAVATEVAGMGSLT
jgi:hypothetical protein